MGIADPARNGYPAQLGAMLGNGYTVRNFGVSGATLLAKGDYPYSRTRAYQDALAFLPDVVVIQLGTNDSLPGNWRYRDEFVNDFLSLIRSFQALVSRPKVLLCTVIPAWRGGGGTADPVIRNEVIPRIREAAKKAGLAVIDLNEAFGNRRDLYLDPLHPNEQGAWLMGETVYSAVKEAMTSMTR